MYDVTKLPPIQRVIEQGAQPATPPTPDVEYVRAPVATGSLPGAGRPPAIQETIR